MFDARSILDAIIAGSSEQTRSVRERGELKDIMGDLLGDLKKAGEADYPSSRDRSNFPGGSSSFDPSGSYEQADRTGRGGDDPSTGMQPGRSRNPLEDLFGELRGDDPQFDDQSDPRRSQSGARPDTGYSDLFERLKDLVGNNKTAAGAIVGGLGGLLLGTKTGRSLTGRAVRLGGLALIGSLAYKAYKNYQQQAANTGARADQASQDDERFGVPELPPAGSGYDVDSMGQDDAALYIRTMVAAAASDGQIDRKEQQTILGNLEQAGLQGEAMEFLANEFNNPASIDQIVDSVRSNEQAAKVYTAARIAIEPDTREEQNFLSDLSQQLDLAPELAAHIDASTYRIKVR